MELTIEMVNSAIKKIYGKKIVVTAPDDELAVRRALSKLRDDGWPGEIEVKSSQYVKTGEAYMFDEPWPVRFEFDLPEFPSDEWS